MRLFLICLSLLYVIGVSYAQRLKARAPACTEDIAFFGPGLATGSLGDSLNGETQQNGVYVLSPHDRQPVDGLTSAARGCRNDWRAS